MMPTYFFYWLVIEFNPGPNGEQGLKFCHWNLNSICAREGIKVLLITDGQFVKSFAPKETFEAHHCHQCIISIWHLIQIMKRYFAIATVVIFGKQSIGEYLFLSQSVRAEEIASAKFRKLRERK